MHATNEKNFLMKFIKYKFPLNDGFTVYFNSSVILGQELVLQQILIIKCYAKISIVKTNTILITNTDSHVIDFINLYVNKLVSICILLLFPVFFFLSKIFYDS